MTHKEISFIKSGIRLFGYLLLPCTIIGAALVLLASEVVGVWEEWNEK